MTPPNPFGSGAPPPPYHPPAALQDAWAAGCRRLLIWGANGLGKSSALAAWSQWVAGGSAATPADAESDPASGMARSAGARHAPVPVRAPGWPSPEAEWWLLDEAEWHPEADLRREVRAALDRGQGALLTSHSRHRRSLAGLDFTVVRLAPLADDAAHATLIAGRLGAHGDWQYAPGTLARWRRLSGGNLRAALRLGYELWESHGPAAHLTPADLTAAAAILRREPPEVLRWRQLERQHRRIRRR